MTCFPTKQAFCIVGMVLALVVLLTACGANNGGAPKSVTLSTQHANSTGTATARSTTTPNIGQGPQTCPTAVNASAYWNPLIATQTGVSQVESVTCGYLKGVPNLQALVTVRYPNNNSLLDVYVYDNLSAASPKQIFKLQNLSKGGAKISPYNTLLTAEVDPASSVNHRKSGATLTQDLFREFKWSPGAGTLVQIAFPGIFPDLTRYQAEADQAQVSQGHDPWKLSAAQTAQAFGASLLQWDPQALATLVSGGGAHATDAVVKLRNTAPGGNGVTLDMTRLEGNTNNGIWIVTTITSDNLSITQPQTASIVHSSATVTGTGSAFEGVIGKVTILDHLYTNIGQATAHGAVGNGSTTFSTGVTSQPTFTNGAEEGLVMLTEENNASGGYSGAVIVKVLIQQ